MGLFDNYFDPQQFPDSGGLLGRLLALQQTQGQDQSTVPGPVAKPIARAWPPVQPNVCQAPTGQLAAAQDLPAQAYVAGSDQSSNIQKVGITSDQSVYCAL